MTFARGDVQRRATVVVAETEVGSLQQGVVVVDIFYLQHIISYGKDVIKRRTRKYSHRRDLLASIVDLTYSTDTRQTQCKYIYPKNKKPLGVVS